MMQPGVSDPTQDQSKGSVTVPPPAPAAAAKPEGADTLKRKKNTAHRVSNVTSSTDSQVFDDISDADSDDGLEEEAGTPNMDFATQPSTSSAPAAVSPEMQDFTFEDDHEKDTSAAPQSPVEKTPVSTTVLQQSEVVSSAPQSVAAHKGEVSPKGDEPPQSPLNADGFDDALSAHKSHEHDVEYSSTGHKKTGSNPSVYEEYDDGQFHTGDHSDDEDEKHGHRTRVLPSGDSYYPGKTTPRTMSNASSFNAVNLLHTKKKHNLAVRIVVGILDFAVSLVLGLVYTTYRMVRAPIALAFSIAAIALLVPHALTFGLARYITNYGAKHEEYQRDYTWKDAFLPNYITNFILGFHAGFKESVVAHLRELGWTVLLAATIASGLSLYSAVAASSTVVPILGKVFPIVANAVTNLLGLPAVSMLHLGYAATLGLSTAIAGSIVGGVLALSYSIGAKIGLDVNHHKVLKNIREWADTYRESDEEKAFLRPVTFDAPARAIIKNEDGKQVEEGDDTYNPKYQDAKIEYLESVEDESSTAHIARKIYAVAHRDMACLFGAFLNEKPSRDLSGSGDVADELASTVSAKGAMGLRPTF